MVNDIETAVGQRSYARNILEVEGKELITNPSNTAASTTAHTNEWCSLWIKSCVVKRTPSTHKVKR